MTVSPNPTFGKVMITSKSRIEKIEVYNMLGNEIISSTNSNSIDLSLYQSGIYLLRIYAGDSVLTQKLIKQ